MNDFLGLDPASATIGLVSSFAMPSSAAAKKAAANARTKKAGALLEESKILHCIDQERKKMKAALAKLRQEKKKQLVKPGP